MDAIASVSWREDGDSETFAHPNELLEALKSVAENTTRDNGIAAVVEKPAGQSLIVVMAGPHWCLDWFPPNYDGTGSYHTVAEGFDAEEDSIPEKPDLITYSYYGHHSEAPLESTIDQSAALKAVEEFLASGDRPKCVQWQLD